MIDTPSDTTVIVGGGLTGISAALHLDSPYLLVEREGCLGGLARTEERDGFFFDRTGHWLHLRDPSMERLVEECMEGDLPAVQRRARVYSHRSIIPYPFQANLHSLPPDVAYQCLLGYIQTLITRQERPPRNFEQYILHHFGEGIARHFMIPYNHKLWGVHPREITSAWCSRFVPIPSMEQMLAGAVGADPQQLGYNIKFRYPIQGGIETLTRALCARLDPERLRLGVKVERVDPARRTLQLGGETVRYGAMVSTMPLPELIGCIEDPPAEVRAAASQLRATAVRYLNVASRTRAPEDFHWIYVPETRLPFYRVGVFSNAMQSMAPPGCSSYYVELSGRHEGQGSQSDVREALEALVEIGALSAVEDVLFADQREISPAYVIFDDNYESALEVIHPYLERHGIFSRGRYGSWIYNAMEDSLLAGRDVARQIARSPKEHGAD